MKEVKYESARLWRSGWLTGGFGVAAAIAACASPGTAVLPESQTTTALTTTTDLDAAQTCLETYVTCVRDGGATCKADLLACWQSAQVTTVDGSDAGAAGPPERSRDGGGPGRTCTKREKGDPAKAKGMRQPPAGCVKKADSCASAKKKTCAKCAGDAVACVVDDASGKPTDVDASTGDSTSTDGTDATSTDTPEAADPPADDSSPSDPPS